MNAFITFVFCLSQAMSSPSVLEKARVTKNTMHNGDNFGIWNIFNKKIDRTFMKKTEILMNLVKYRKYKQ